MSEFIFRIFALLLGAIVGSFLNACIHRMPRGVSLNTPRRSFCPNCERVIPWYENLPLVSWLALRGKCSGCGWRIPARYFLVEALTAFLFAAVWERFGLPLAVVYLVFVSLLVVATFIAFDHFIIPDEITWGGATAGVVLSVAFPQMMNAASRWEALAYSLGGASLGFGLLFLVVEGGKLERLSRKVKRVVIPREAVGFGDVKFIACIGAFLGWQAVLFTLLAASIIGSVVGFAGIALARDRAGVRFPLGPFLALSGLLWIFGARDLMEWYLGVLRGVGGFF